MFEHIEVAIPPVDEPVDIEELKGQARIVGDEEDARLFEMLVSAREAAELYTRRSLMIQTLDVWYNDFKTLSYLELPRGKVQSIIGLWTYDYNNVATEISSSTYVLDGGDLVLNQLTLGISGYRMRRGIKVRIVSGYGQYPEDVPASIRQGILEYAAWMYDHPAGESDVKYVAQAGSGAIPEGVRSKWQRYQLMMV